MRDAELLRTYTETMRAETCEHLHLGYAPAPTAAVIASILGRYHEQAPGASVSVIAAVEAGHAPAVVGEFTTAVAGDRVHYIRFVSKASFMHVGLLYRKSETGENVKKLIASCLDVKQAFK